MPDYGLYYELESALQQDPSLVAAKELYSFDNDKLYAAIMDRLAQPLPNGDPSPFSAKTPGSAHAILAGVLIYLQGLAAHEMNLTPDGTILEWLRLLGTTLREAEYPIINVRFSRSADAVANNIPVTVPAGLEVRSFYDSSRSAYTIVETNIPITDDSALVPCRISEPGAITNLVDGEFSQMARGVPFVDTVASEGVVTPGRDAERLIDAVLRTRDWLRTGDRCLTDRDYAYFAIQAGASKVNVTRGRMPGVDGYYRDLRTIAIYPPAMQPIVDAALQPRKLLDERLTVVAAEVIPLSGVIQVKAVDGLTQFEVFNLAATAISQNLNPPSTGGIWGDKQLEKTIASILERVQGIYAVPSVELTHAETGEAFSSLTLEPWQLAEVQQNIQIQLVQ